jgi:hypothetical protein
MQRVKQLAQLRVAAPRLVEQQRTQTRRRTLAQRRDVGDTTARQRLERVGQPAASRVVGRRRHALEHDHRATRRHTHHAPSDDQRPTTTRPSRFTSAGDAASRSSVVARLSTDVDASIGALPSATHSTSAPALISTCAASRRRVALPRSRGDSTGDAADTALLERRDSTGGDDGAAAGATAADDDHSDDATSTDAATPDPSPLRARISRLIRRKYDAVSSKSAPPSRPMVRVVRGESSAGDAARCCSRRRR